MTSVLAIVCVRNESLHIRRCLRDLCGAGIEVVLIDNDSTDDTLEAARPFLGRGLRAIERLPWRGVFSLSEQLALKASIAAGAPHDWIVHADADEWLTPPPGSGTLREAIAGADAAGYTCINFHEFAFVPLPGEDFTADEYAAHMRTYYFFEPFYPRLMRAWRRDAGLHYGDAGGHVLAGNPRMFPVDFALRHYVMLSEAQGRVKYLGRRFAAEELAKGWHSNRTRISAENLWVADRPELRRLADPSSRTFDTSAPLRSHFWEWGTNRG